MNELIMKHNNNDTSSGYLLQKSKVNRKIYKDTNYRFGIDKLQAYLKVDPISSETQFYLANGYANLGMLDSAIICAKKSIASYPEYSKGLFSLHQFFMNLKKYDEAVKVMDRYLVARPQDAEGYIMKAQSQLKAGQQLQARPDVTTWFPLHQKMKL
jgi:tetratricopeptide (TPR) repeat protein